MTSGRWWLAAQVTKRLGFRATLYAVIAVVTAVLSIAIGPFIPDSLSNMVGASAVDSILTIIAASMLAVTTFSLSTLVSATTAAATSGTPRAISLLLQDETAQSALSTFLGAFLFSLVGLIALNTGLYSGGGRLVLFVATLAVVILIVTMLLRWIGHLAGLGQVGETIRRVAEAAETAYVNERRKPCLGGLPLDDIPVNAVPIFHPQTGYVRHLDMGLLSSAAEACQMQFYVVQRPGDFCSPNRPILYLLQDANGETDMENLKDDLFRAFVIGPARSFDQDPLFGLTALSEIASHALSPAINDPGTAIDVISQLTRILGHESGKQSVKPLEPDCPRIHVKKTDADDYVKAAFLAISRDGAGMIEVGLVLQHALSALATGEGHDLTQAARAMAKTALERGLATLAFEDDRARLLAVHKDESKYGHLG
ncbi:MAG: DUF2254 domain-containing protein [Allorhizobium sp.]